MKNRIIKNILVLLLIFVAMPVMGQDYMNIFFKDGSHLKFFMPSLKELYVSSYDSEGYFQSDYKYQYLVTNSGKYVYDLSDIDYITYTKCDEEEVEQNIVNSISTIIPILEECSSITEVEKRLDDVKMAEGIEDAWSDGSQLCVKIKDWGTMAFHFHDESYDDDDDAWEAKVMKKMASLRPIIKKAVANGKTLKVAIANQTKNNDMPSFTKIEKRFQKIISLFESLGINPVPVDPTIDFFRTGMYEYDFVVLCTHGSIMTDNKGRLWYDEFGDPVHFMFTSDYLGAISKTYFSTNEPSNEELKEPIRQLKTLLKQKGLEDYFSNDEIRVDWIEELRGFGDYWIAYPLVTENFIRDASESQFSNPNSILFAAVCHSLEGKSSLANKLQDKKNLGSYLGYDGEIDTGKGSNAALSFIMSLLSGYSIKKSEENIPDEYKIDTSFRKNTKLVPELSNNGQDFLFPTVTKQIDQTTAQNAFNSFGYVEVEGNTTCIDPNADDVVKMGFQYSTNENFSPASSVVSSDVIKLTKPLDNGNGNVQFRAQLTGLQPGNTYFYRAYTYDGLNYNYGEPCPLEISEPQADEKQVMLTQNVGGTTYEIYKINTDTNDYHINPDGWKCYKSSLMLDMTKNGKTSTYTLDDNIYLDSSESHHGGQRPCLYISSSSDQLFVFINSKDSRNNYTMDGYAYRTSLSNVSFTRETVFTGRNWGWYPYFTYSDGVLSVQHFSYAGYYAMTSYRNSDGTWTTKQGNYIKPDAFNEQSEQAGNVLIDDNPGLALSQTQLSIVAGGSTTVEITSGSGVYGVTNLNSSIARGTLQGTTVTIDGVAVGNDAKIVVTDMQTGLQIIITVTVTGSSGSIDANGHEYVDLGLPSGVKWASCNVGATKPEEYGSYFSWGETEEKDTYDWSTYKWCNGSWNTQTKYCTKSSYGNIDNKTVLDPGDDVAHVKWGGSWRMPTQDEFQELYDNCNIEWTTINGVKGRKFTSNTNGNFIFFPTAGRIVNSGLNDVGDVGYFWSSSLNVTSPYCARRMYFEGTMFYFYSVDRYHGQSVRPVCK